MQEHKTVDHSDKGKRKLVEEVRTLRSRLSELEQGNIIGMQGVGRDITDRKKAEEALRESEQRYLAIFKQAADSIVLIDAETGELVEFNDKAHENLGYSREEFQKLRIPDFEIIESAEEVAKRIEKIVREEADAFETKHRTKDGQIRDVLVSSRTISIGGKNFCQGIWRDITELKRAEEELRESEERYREQFEHALDAIFVADAETGILVDCNRAALKLVGRARSELIGQHQRILHPPEELEKGLSKSFKQHLEEKEGQILEAKIITKEGQIKDVIIMANMVGIGGKKVLRGTFHDITARKRAEEALRESEGKYRTLIDNSLTGIFIHQDGKYVFVNDRFAEIHAFTSEELLGRECLQLIHPDDREMVADIISKRQAGEDVTQRYEMRRLKKDGQAIRCEMMANLVEYMGKPAVMGNVVDITERRKAEEQARRDRAELERTSRLITVGEMASGLAHELNQPLCAILNYADGCLRMVRTETPDSGKLEGAIEAIAAQADRAGEIIRRIRNLVTKRELEQSTVNLNDIVREIVEMEKAEASQNNITVQTELAEDMPLVLADKIEIEQVVLNLVRNAFDAMSDTAVGERKLTIRTSRLRSDSIELAVCDTGQGLPAEDAEKLFDSFFTTKPDGLGIGLSLSRSIIKAHGGRLWAEPNPDCGATFRFTLPLKGG